MNTEGFTRRWMLQAGAVSSALVALGGASAEASEYDPRKTNEGLLKLNCYMDGRPAPWWYGGTIYVVRERQKPMPLIKFEGSETSWIRHQSDGSALLHNRTLTFFQDLGSGDYLDNFDNPFTGKRNALKANFISGNGLYPADGSQIRMLDTAATSETSPLGHEEIDPNKPIGSFEWIVSKDIVLTIGNRAAPSVLQPSMEAQSVFGDRKMFFDPTVKAMPAQFTSTTFSPYMGWMDMADEPGHLVWHASGLKLEVHKDLPERYLARAEKIKPGVLLSAPQWPTVK